MDAMNTVVVVVRFLHLLDVVSGIAVRRGDVSIDPRVVNGIVARHDVNDVVVVEKIVIHENDVLDLLRFDVNVIDMDLIVKMKTNLIVKIQVRDVIGKDIISCVLMIG